MTMPQSHLSGFYQDSPNGKAALSTKTGKNGLNEGENSHMCVSVCLQLLPSL